MQNAINTSVELLSTVVTSMSEFYIVEILYSGGGGNKGSGMAEKIAI